MLGYRSNEQHIFENLDQCPFRQSKLMLFCSNFDPLKSTVVGRNFGTSKITVVARNFRLSKTTIVDHYFEHPNFCLWTVFLDNYYFFLHMTVVLGQIRVV